MFLSFKRWIQTILLVFILLISWFFLSILKFIKGDKWHEEKLSILGLDANKADADVPSSTPYLAVWNGDKYKLENDFLFGKPKSLFSTHEEGKREYEAGRINPDLYKLQSIPKQRDGILKFQIQEFEPEESFFNGLEFLRVVHPHDSEVFVDSEYKGFSVINNGKFSKNILRAKTVKKGECAVIIENNPLRNDNEKIFDLKKGESLEINFSNLNKNKEYCLILEAKGRNWLIARTNNISSQAQFYARKIVSSKVFSRSMAMFFAFWGLWALFKIKSAYTLPYFLLDTGSGSGSGSGGGGGDTGDSVGYKCLQVFYKTKNGGFIYASTMEPRVLNYVAEFVSMPYGIISDSGDLNIKIFATEKHSIRSIGLIEKQDNEEHTVENLKITKAVHSRLKKDMKDRLFFDKSDYLHLVPGDVVDLEVNGSNVKLKNGERETYLARAGGFYTGLTSQGKRTAGRWMDKINEEDKERFYSFFS